MRASRWLWTVLITCYALHQWALSEHVPRLAGMAALLFWPLAPLVLYVACRRVFVDAKWLLTDFFASIIFFREVCFAFAC